MTAEIVVAVFESEGIALDAYHRLHTEGVPKGDTTLRGLREIGSMPASMAPELAALAVDPPVWRNVRETFSRFIHNGETAVLVRAYTAAEAEFAAMTMKQYEPVAIEVMALQTD